MTLVHPAGEVPVRLPLRRFAQPEEVADLAAFLLGPSGCSITGPRLVICAGRRLTGTAYTAPPRVLGLLADDLTGAADSAVGFAEHGWQFELALRSAAPRMLNGPLDDGGRWLVSPDAGLVPLQSVAGGG